MSDDLNIFHTGGCGGMYLFHQFLATDSFFSFFHHNLNYDDVRNAIFEVKNPDNWKSTEIWPLNHLTQKMKVEKRKIYFNCKKFDDWISLTGKKVLVVTDLKSQIRMSWYKKSTFFQFEKQNDSKNFYFLCKDLLKQNKNSEFHKEIYDVMPYADVIVNFQDLLNPIGLEKVLNSFGCEINQKNIDFLNHYLTLHPKKLLQKIGIK